MVPFVAASTTTIESKSSEDVTESWWWLVIQPGSTTTTAAAALDGNNKNIDGNYAGFSAAKASLRVRELDVSVISTPYPTPGLRSTPAPTSTASPGPQTSAATESDGGGSGGSDDWAVATVILGVAAAIVVVSGGLFLAYRYHRKRRQNPEEKEKKRQALDKEVAEEDLTAPANRRSPRPQTPDASRMPITIDASAHADPGALSRSAVKNRNSFSRAYKPDLGDIEEVKDESNKAAPPEVSSGIPSGVRDKATEPAASSSEQVTPSGPIDAHEAGRGTTAMGGAMTSLAGAMTSSEARRGDDGPNLRNSGRGVKGVSVLASPENYGLFPQPFSDIRKPVHPYSPLPSAMVLLGSNLRGVEARDGDGDGNGDENGNGNGNRDALASSDLPGNHNDDGLSEFVEVGGTPQVDVVDLVLDNNDYYDRVVDESGTLREVAEVVAVAAAEAAAASAAAVSASADVDAEADEAMMTRGNDIMGGIFGGEETAAEGETADPSALPKDEKLAASSTGQEHALGGDKNDAMATGTAETANTVRVWKLEEGVRPRPGSGRGHDYRRSRSAALDTYDNSKNRGETTPHTSAISSSSSSSPSSSSGQDPSPSPSAMWGGAREWQRQRPGKGQRLRPLALRSRLLRRASSMFTTNDEGSRLSVPLPPLVQEAAARRHDTIFGRATSGVELAPATKDGRAASRSHFTPVWEQRAFSLYENGRGGVGGGVSAGLRGPPRRSVSMAPRVTFLGENGGSSAEAVTGVGGSGGAKRVLPPRPIAEDRRVSTGANLPPMWSKVSSSSSSASAFSLLPGFSRVGIGSALGCGGGGDAVSSGQPTPVRRGTDRPMTFDVGAHPPEKIGWWGKRSRRVWAASDGADGGDGYTTSPFFVCGEVVATPPRPPRELAPREIHDGSVSKRVRGGEGGEGSKREEKGDKDTRFKDTGMSASPATAVMDTE